MKKWTILLLLILVIPQTTYALISDTCLDNLLPGQDCIMLTPVLNDCTAYDYIIYNQSSNITQGSLGLLQDGIYYLNFSQPQGEYIVKLCNNATREITVLGEDSMGGSFSVTLFVMVISVGLFLLGLFVDFSRNRYVNFILKRCAIVISIYLMMLNSAIIMSIASFVGIPVTREITTYMWLLGVAGYVTCGVLAFTTLIQTMKMWRIDKAKNNMDEEEEEDVS